MKSGADLALVPQPASGSPPATAEPEFLTPEEAAALLRITVKTLREYAREGKIPGARLFGNVIRIHRPTLVASCDASTDRRPWRRSM